MSAPGAPRSRFNLFQSLRPLSRQGSIRDALAGFQLAAMNIPQALGYTKIAGTPVVTGFYTLLLPLVAFAAFGSSRYLVVSADSATAAILSGGLAGLAPLGSARYVELTSLTAMLTAVFLILARLLKLGFLADFLSQTVLVGFLTGVGFQVGIAVLGEMVGIEIASRRTVMQVIELSRNLSHVHLPTLAVSVVIVLTIFLLGAINKKIPAPLIAVVGAVAASATWNFDKRGIAIVGRVAGGLPHLGFPHASWHDLSMLVGISGSCFVMILAQSAATARFYASRHHQRLDEDDDLVGLAAANAVAGLSGTFVVNGSGEIGAWRVSFLLLSAPWRRLWQADALQRLHRGHGNELVEHVFAEHLIHTLDSILPPAELPESRSWPSAVRSACRDAPARNA